MIFLFFLVASIEAFHSCFIDFLTFIHVNEVSLKFFSFGSAKASVCSLAYGLAVQLRNRLVEGGRGGGIQGIRLGVGMVSSQKSPPPVMGQKK